ncbi:MAG TPA: histidine kinase [Rhizorhapis sp.]
MLLACDPEWLIGVGRLVTSLFAVVAMHLDPTQPAAFRHESKVIIGLYVAFSLLMVLFPLRRPLDSKIHLAVHSVDIAVLGCLAVLTDELASPFFSFLPFVLLVTTMRWGLGGAILGAVVLETVLFAVGLPDLQDGESELNIFVTRSAYFAVAATMLGYFGAYRERSRQRLAQLADWPFDAIAGNRQHWLGSLFQHAADVLGEPRLLVLWRDQEEPSGSVAYWSKGELKLVDVSDKAFWLQHDPEGPHGQDRILPGAPDDKLFSIFRSLPELAIRPPMSVRYACSGAFSSIRYRGKVFVINPSCQLDESVSLTGIIAARLGSELERLALMQQAAETARSQERVRLARDLHDSILQDLTAANLKLKMIANTAPDDVKLQLGSVNMLVFDQQRRIRKFVEDRRSSEGDFKKTLSPELSHFVAFLRKEWDCQIDLVLDPPDMEVPCWIVHEISQIISEATANAVRHGGATHVCVTLTRSRGELEFCISDNGSGMQKAGSPRRPQSLTARVADLGGRLTIRRFAPGLDLRIDLPLETELR